MKFQPGDPVEYDSEYAKRAGCVTFQDQKIVLRGVYVKRVNDVYSDVSVAGMKPLLVRTSRLRRAAQNTGPGPRGVAA